MSSPFGKISDIINQLYDFRTDAWRTLFPLLSLVDLALHDPDVAKALADAIGRGSRNPDEAVISFITSISAAKDFITTNLNP